MNFKPILIVVAIISLVVLASYLFTQKSVKEGEVCPPTPPVKQNAQQPVTKAQKSVTGIKVTFVELGSVGCIPCDMMQPILSEIRKEYEGQVNVLFYNLKSISDRPYAEKYKAQFIPTQVFLDKDGNEYYRHVGFFPKDEVVKILELRGVK
jgi:thioredoxin 1